jgi:hypothetical protein
MAGNTIGIQLQERFARCDVLSPRITEMGVEGYLKERQRAVDSASNVTDILLKVLIWET